MKFSNRRAWSRASLFMASAALGALASEAHAQSGPQVEDVVITARKVTENLQDAPIAVTAFSGTELQTRGLQEVANLALATPNLNITNGISGGSSSTTAIFIRGIGQRDFIPTVDPGVGVYRDGVYLGRSVGSNLDFADIARIEVLRGPQGTLYGKNTIGGAVSIITREPSFEGEVEAGVTIGERNRFDLDFLASGPLVADKLAGKLVFASRSADGYVDRITDGRKFGDDDRYTAKAELLWRASDTLNFRLAADILEQRQESGATSQRIVDQANPNTGAPTLVASWNATQAARLGQEPLTTATALSGGPYQVKGTAPSYDNVDSWGVSLTADWDIGGAALKSITSYRDLQSGFSSPGQPIFANLNLLEQSQFSQELQLTGSAFDDRLDWLLGAFYFTEDAYSVSGARLWTGFTITIPSLAACQAGVGAVCQDFNSDNIIDTTGESTAVFAQGTWKFTDRLSFTGGARYTQEEKDFTVLGRQLQINRIAAQGSASDSWDDVSPMASLDWRATDDALLYAKVARGFKSGGFNGRPNNTQSIQPVDPETVISYETGAKTDWLNGRLRVNLAAFLNQYENYQEVVAVTDPAFGILSLVENIGELETKGFEVEITARVSEPLTVFASVGYTDAKYKKVGVTSSFSVEDKPVQIPEWTTNLGFNFAQNLGPGELSLRADWSYNSGYENYINNVKAGPADTSFRGGVETKSFSIVNTRIAYAPENTPWEFALYGKNILDEFYWRTSGYNSGGGTGSGVPNEPRELGVRITYRR